MEDAVESVVVEEQSKQIVKSKSLFQRFRNRSSSSENNNAGDIKDRVKEMREKMVPNDQSEMCVKTTADFQPHQRKPNGVKEKILNGIKETRSSIGKNSTCLLLRLFESTMFDMSIAMSYLFKSKESGVQAYLGNKLFVREV